MVYGGHSPHSLPIAPARKPGHEVVSNLAQPAGFSVLEVFATATMLFPTALWVPTDGAYILGCSAKFAGC